MPLIPILRRLKQELKFKASLGYIVRLFLKKQNKTKKQIRIWEPLGECRSCSDGYMTLCICQNPQNFTAQRINLNVCCKLKNH
jgi:hypothetical protein